VTVKVGEIDILPVKDGTGAIPPSLLFAASENDWEPHRRFLDDNGLLPLEIGGFLLRGVGDRVLLVDVGLGPLGAQMGMGRFVDSLRALGVDPDDVTDVLLTHLHIDHIGWATVEGEPTFSNATYRCAASDWAYFVDPGGSPPNPMAALLGAPSEAQMLEPVANRVEPWSEGPLFPGVDLRTAPGHTPGSTVIVISSGTERGLLIGDVAHCPVELLETDWEALSDVDPDLARRTRGALAREFEGTDVPIAASHFQDMKFGRLLTGQGRRQWVIE
jgi:glyoxylase-like metal-dependent hydrolase (beta-lactamase superfamily II)